MKMEGVSKYSFDTPSEIRVYLLFFQQLYLDFI